MNGDGDDGEIEVKITPRPKVMARSLTRLTDRGSVALTAQAQCVFFSAGEARLTCAHKVVTRISGRHSYGVVNLEEDRLELA